MITIGATTWSEHKALITEDRPVTLAEYAANFPVVEVDTFFYGIPRISTVKNWQAQVPPTFHFVVKAHRSMTGHIDKKANLTELKETFTNFKLAVGPLVETGQLKTVLFQFPPYFIPTKKSINYLRQIRAWLPELPLCLEFRNQAWYQPNALQSLVAFCRQEQFTLTAADEPHQTEGSVPFYPVVTTLDLMFWRLHGRNQQGWLKKGPNWRKERTLYRYDHSELEQFKQTLVGLQNEVKEICIIFNNNSAGDAVPNALALKELLGIDFDGLGPPPPIQLDLI